MLEFLYRLEDEINRARYEIDEKYHMGQAELRARFLQMAAMEQIRNLTEPKRTEERMPTIAEQLKAARADIAAARQGAVEAVTQTGEAVQVVQQEIIKLKKEAADFRAEVAELTNGGPEL